LEKKFNFLPRAHMLDKKIPDKEKNLIGNLNFKIFRALKKVKLWRGFSL